MSNFRSIDRQTGFLLPPSVDDWLPERHLARFVVEVIDGLDLSAMSRSYRGTGSASYHPALLLGILGRAMAIGEQSIVTDAMHALGQHMHEEAADERVGWQRNGLVAA